MATEFPAKLISWQKNAGRHDLPWQKSRDPYSIWVSEIMLQQTRVSTVIPYYLRFMEKFPDVHSLANASLDEVLSLWSGLGYYARAKNLHKAAIIVKEAGTFPEDLSELPGIGKSTAAAISAFAHSKRAAILDGNVKRVLARHFAIEGFPGEKSVENAMWQLAESLLPENEIECYTQALMDLGSGPCSIRQPDCSSCPVQASCAALACGKVEEFPEPRPKKPLPNRETRLLVLFHEEKILLSRRPEKGVWAGLLCLPEIGEGWEEQFRAQKAADLPGFTHGFTHFRLKIEAVLARTDSPGDGIWMRAEQALTSSIPNPVRKILSNLP
ncbi:MAG: A/G-specific adenine glycosylase [Burkholderiales bacterium]|nr:A/G-specific adenine glycosylase [Burkholderiales bacterium]